MNSSIRHVLPALALACVLSLAWAWTDRANLSALRLPDTDDAMRLQQVRDWIAGQAFGDIAQHRLAGGLAMHWSRIGDLVPAAVILALRPLAGQHWAEIIAVIAWPLMQFTAYLMLAASIARRLAPAAAGTALVLAALAYPVTSLFLPGRIDHHGMQIVLVLVQIAALLAPAGWRSGAVAGGALAAGATIGLETLPFAVVSGAIVVQGWLRGEDARQRGFGLALAIGIAVLLPFAGQGATCDTIRPLAPAAIAGGLGLAALTCTRHRTAFLTVLALTMALLFRAVGERCLAGPYGAMDPLVARLWLAHVAEARPLFASPAADALGYAGLSCVGTVAGGWLAWRRRGGWIVPLAYQLAALALTMAQLRGAYLGAALAAVPVATLLSEARAAGRSGAVIALWLAGTGIVWPIVGAYAAPGGTAATAAGGVPCTGPDALALLDTLPEGRIMATIDLGAYAIANTRHGVVAAPYHRNDAGNVAMYRFFLSSPDAARRIAGRWRVDYVVICPGDFGERTVPPGSIAGGVRPSWLVRVPTERDGPAIYAVHHIRGATSTR